MEFDFEIQHRPGQKYMAANALSRFPTSQKDDFDTEDDIQIYVVADIYTRTSSNAEKFFGKLTIIQTFLATQKEKVCYPLVV